MCFLLDWEKLLHGFCSLSLIRLGIGFGAAFFVENSGEFARYFFNEPNTGAMINEGMKWLGFSIGFGILAEIGQAIASSEEIDQESS